ncbi:MAG: response regulator, partial [Pseudomonadota bacterium]
IDEAETSMWRARDVIGEMMDFAGNFPKTPITTIDLNDVVARVITGMEPDLPESIETELILHEPMPPITGRTMQLHRVITNIAINAVDSLRGRSGRVTVGLSLSKVSRAEQDRCLTGFCKAITGDAIKLEIRDNGPGMDVEAAEKAFDPFFSSKGVTRGLGLSGALGVARRFPMGLTFDSTPGVGTSFCLYFQPADTDASGHVKTPMERASSLGTILVLDDQSEVLATVAKLVRTLGFAVIEASSGEDAIEVAKASRRIDAALIDVVMPGMDGWTTLQNLREALPGLPAAMMTGYSDASLTKQRAIDLDLDLEVLQKPFNREALEQAISNLVKGIALSARVGAE